MTLVAPGLSLRRLGYAMSDLALPCHGCGALVTPASNAYDTFTYGCPCGRAFTAQLHDIIARRPPPGTPRP